MKHLKKGFLNTGYLIPVKYLVHKAKRIITTQMNFINFLKKVKLKFERQLDEFILQLMKNHLKRSLHKTVLYKKVLL